MPTLNLLQVRRRDGSLAIRGTNPWDEPKFPEEYDFGFAQIGEGTYPAKIEGDTIKVEYVNAKAVYKIDGPLRQPNGTHGEGGYTERPDQGFHAHLVEDSVEFFDAPEVTEEGIAAYQGVDASEPADEAGKTVAKAGAPIVDDKPAVDSSNGGNV